MKRRQPKVSVSRRRGVSTPQELSEALTAYLTNKTDRPPTLRLNDRRMA